MKLTPQDFVSRVIVPALTVLNLDSPEARSLLLGTAIQESGLRNIQQDGGGPAMGYFQMERATHDSLHANFLAYHQTLDTLVRSLLPPTVDPFYTCLILYPVYAAGMCRVKYLDCPGTIPDTLEGQAAYYKENYNTPQGKATPQQYIDNWNKVVGVWPFTLSTPSA